LKLTPTKSEVATAIPAEEVPALTTSTRFQKDGFGSSAKSLESGTRALIAKPSHFVSSPRGVIDRLKAAAIEIAKIAVLIAGFIIAVLCALDLSDMLRW
jgi:hypothetical protein